MTTNVLDLRNDTASTDSRWSISIDDKIIFVDDSGFDKILEKNRFLLVFAGNSVLIQQFKDWAKSDGEIARPTDEEIDGEVAITITDMDSGLVVFEATQKHPLEDARFAGTGATYAMMCWNANQCAKTAVSTAIQFDAYSGGEVKYYHFSGDNNISPDGRSDDIVMAILERGAVMYKHNGMRTTPISEAAKVDPTVKAVIDRISSGTLQPCAPFPEMNIPWTPDDHRRLGRALDMVLKRK